MTCLRWLEGVGMECVGSALVGTATADGVESRRRVEQAAPLRLPVLVGDATAVEMTEETLGRADRAGHTGGRSARHGASDGLDLVGIDHTGDETAGECIGR